MKTIIAVTTLALLAACQSPHTGSGDHAHATGHAGTVTDTRQPVRFPEPMRIHTLANMRDHLDVMGQITAALAQGAYDTAADLAEQRLGMSSLALHGAHDVARYMPQGMQDAGTAMHRSASRLARQARDASATGEIAPVLSAMATLNQTCVACHAAYRLE